MRSPPTTPRKINPYPSRPILRPSIPACVPSATLESWASSVGLILGPLVPDETARHQVLSLLYHYRHLNGTSLKNLPCTDIITHRVRIKPGTKPASNSTQKRWPTHTEWWLRKIIQEGLDGGIYEHTEAANGRLSRWNARAVVVDKVENPTPQDEPRVTFDYSRVSEDLPGTHMELSAKVHDNLSDPRHKCLFAADIKYAYHTIPLHEDDRHFFAFTISGIGQLQPTRMQQGSQSAGFTMTEAAYRAFGALPSPLNEPSLLHSNSPAYLPPLTFYTDDFFGGFPSFEEQYEFLRTHFLPRVEWARFQLSFKKLKLFQETITALGVAHTIGGLVRVLEDRINKVARWPVPTDQSGVRAFLGVIGIIKRWVKNFAELARPLTRLTGKVPFKWDSAEQLSFEILKIKCCTRSAMHGIDLTKTVHFYTDASAYAAGLAITQFIPAMRADVPTKNGLVEVPIIYDSFPFTATQRRYPTYKRELFAIMKFASKYDYLCKHPYQQTIIHTDHKPLTHFLKSDAHEGLYGNWADQLRRLNISIQYIPGHRNKVADGLSRTLFDAPGCSEDCVVKEAKDELAKQGPQWIWKDGKGGFEDFLASLDPELRKEVLTNGTKNGIPLFSHSLTFAPMDSWRPAYEASDWFGDIYRLLDGTATSPSPELVRKAYDYRVTEKGVLWVHRRGGYLPCIPEAKVLSVLMEAHDVAGHWGKAGTMVRLRNLCYWPGQSDDVERYIDGCLACAKHGPATRSQPLHPILVTYPFQLMGMDFIGPLPKTRAGAKFILTLICYATNFTVPFATKTANVEEVLWCLPLFFAMYRKPQAFYVDPGQHFNNDELREFLAREGVAIEYSPSGSSKSTGMVEVHNKLLEQVLRKDNDREWDVRLPRGASCTNQRIIGYLGLSPCDMLFGQSRQVTPITSTLLALPNRDIEEWAKALSDPLQHAMEVHTYLRHRAETQDVVYETKRKQKEANTLRYNKGVKQTVHALGSFVMLYQKKTGKLEPRWRGPFVVYAYGSDRQLSYQLRQLNGRRIRGKFHGDHLRQFVPRCGYLANPSDPVLPQQQTIRKSRRERPRARLFLRPPKPPGPLP